MFALTYEVCDRDKGLAASQSTQLLQNAWIGGYAAFEKGRKVTHLGNVGIRCLTWSTWSSPAPNMRRVSETVVPSCKRRCLYLLEASLISIGDFEFRRYGHGLYALRMQNSVGFQDLKL